MRITVQVLTKSMDIEVGEGQQNVKWLAQVVSARIAQLRLLRSTFEEEKQLVIGITDSDGSLLDPNATIEDVIEDDGVVRANVTDEITSDLYGNPVLPVWRQEAFIHSGPGKIFARGHEAWRRNPSRMRTATTPGEPGQDSLIFIGELSDSDICAALELDWSMIDWTWAVVDPTDDFLFRLKDAVQAHYGVVCRLFAFCAGSGRPGERYGLTLADFKHILYSSGLFPLKATKKMEAIFVQAAGEMPITDNAPSRPATAAASEGSKYALLSRSEFMEAICRIAVGDRVAASFAPAANEDHVLRTVPELLAGPLNRYWQAVHEKMESSSDSYTSELLQHCHVYLKDIFENYGTVTREGPVITIATFRDIIYGSEVAEERLAYNQILEDVFLRQCRVVLPQTVGYNTDHVANDGSQTPGSRSGFGKQQKHQNSGMSTPSGADEIEELTFSEFREALVKAIKYAFSRSDELTDEEKMQAGFEKVIQIVTRPHK